MHKLVFAALACLLPLLAHAQPAAKVHRIGVVHLGGSYEAVVAGLRAGLKDAGLSEGKHFVMHVRNTKAACAT